MAVPPSPNVFRSSSTANRTRLLPNPLPRISGTTQTLPIFPTRTPSPNSPPLPDVQDHDPCRADGFPLGSGQDVCRGPVVGVHLHLLRNALLVDEDPAADPEAQQDVLVGYRKGAEGDGGLRLRGRHGEGRHQRGPGWEDKEEEENEENEARWHSWSGPDLSGGRGEGREWVRGVCDGKYLTGGGGGGGTDVPCRHSRIWAVEIGSLDGCLEHGREKVLSFALDNVSQSFLWGFYWPLGRDGTRNRGRNHPVLLGPPDAGAGQGILLSARIHPNGRSRRRTVGEYTCSERARSGSMHRG